MLVIILANVIIGFFISYLCLKGLGFNFTVWTMGINFMVGGVVLALSASPVWENRDDTSLLTFLASLMVIVGAILFIMALVTSASRRFTKHNVRNLGIILEVVGIIALITLWRRPVTWTEVIIPELSVVGGLYLIIKNR